MQIVLTSCDALLVHQSGTYTWGAIGQYLVGDIAQFPTNCYLNLYPNRASDGKGVLGGNFTMTSTSGVARTWAASTTINLPTSTTTPITSSSQTMSTTTSVVPGSSPSTPITSPTPPSPPSSLSTGAKAGIGVGAAVGGLLLLGAFIYIIFLHRRFAKTNRPQTAGEISGSPIYEKSGEPGREFA